MFENVEFADTERFPETVIPAAVIPSAVQIEDEDVSDEERVVPAIAAEKVLIPETYNQFPILRLFATDIPRRTKEPEPKLAESVGFENKVDEPVPMDVFPEREKLPSTNKLFDTLMPPYVMMESVFVLVELFVLFIDREPLDALVPFELKLPATLGTFKLVPERIEDLPDEALPSKRMPRTLAFVPTVKDLAILQGSAEIIDPVTAEEESEVEIKSIAAEKVAVLFTLRTYNVEVPVTFKLPPTVALLCTAITPEIIVAPEETPVESVVFNNHTRPENMGEDRVEVPVKMVPPEKVKFPDMSMFALILSPLATVNAPMEGDNEFVVFEIAKVPADDREDASDTDPEMVAVPAMLMVPPVLTKLMKAAPPDKIKDPVVTLEESAVLVILMIPKAENEEESINPPLNKNICNAPDEILVKSIWLPTNKEQPEKFPVTMRFKLKETIPVTVVLPPTTIRIKLGWFMNQECLLEWKCKEGNCDHYSADQEYEDSDIWGYVCGNNIGIFVNEKCTLMEEMESDFYEKCLHLREVQPLKGLTREVWEES
ncbi:hypothetical protein BDK51DRAFT_34599 [Blyttiomyces helicus]|uniref:Uncharacterized protein n=1 Tax=Blyttiomyces helicus TaxID=388810 RepID=A0A4P9WTQ0_9FUNG|nr:hypothetical protein BDK51DRAFT_34599 [Blyttiomyces helicus]|eukprot:RKO94740.1 hypothetical protein BDK51DRAFT_34599 [Blyttiomyces helicus]